MRRRVLLLEYMRRKNVNNYMSVAALISSYYRDAEKTVAKVEREMSDLGALGQQTGQQTAAQATGGNQ